MSCGHLFAEIIIAKSVMENYKLYDIIRSLDATEVRQLRKMLKSPFFVLREDVGMLFNTLAKYHLKGKAFPGKEQIFEKVYTDRKYDDHLLRGTMSDLFERIEEYLLIANRRAQRLQSKIVVARMYRQRQLSKCFNTAINAAEKLINRQSFRNEFYYKNLLDFQLEKMENSVRNQRTKIFNLEEVSNTMDILYLVQRLRHTCTQFTHQQVYKTDYDFGLLQHLLPIIEQDKYLSIPAVAIYYNCYRFLSDTDGAVFFQRFKTQLFKSKQLFDFHELKVLYLFAINYCIRKLNEGEKLFTREIFDLYREGVQAGYFLEHGVLSRFTYNNVVAAGILLKEFEWIEDFIVNFAGKLEEEYQPSTLSFNLARLEYSRKNYGKAMMHLQTAEYKDLVNNLICKTILMKIYYELEEYDALFSHLDSFEIYIRRGAVSDFHRKNFMNVIRFVKKIVGLPTYNKAALKKLRKEIMDTEVLSESDWLLEKLNTL